MIFLICSSLALEISVMTKVCNYNTEDKHFATIELGNFQFKRILIAFMIMLQCIYLKKISRIPWESGKCPAN